MTVRRPKVALYDPSGSGGVAHYTFKLAEGLAEAGWRVTIITSEDYELKDFPRAFDVWFLFKKSRVRSLLTRFSTLRAKMPVGAIDRGGSPPHEYREGKQAREDRLIRHLRTLRFTASLFMAAFVLFLDGTRIVHFQWFIDRKADVHFMKLLRFLGFKIVYTAHDVLPLDEDARQTRRFYQRVYQYPDKLIVHSENNRSEMLELFSMQPDRLCVIPLGCESVLFDFSAGSPTTARGHLGIPENKRVILFFGLIKRYKGLEFLLQAFETISTKCDDVILVIAGKIADHDADSHRYYSALLNKYSGDRRIRFTNEYVPVDRVAHYFFAADLVVLPYTRASQSAVLLTAYAAGKPVVVTDVGGLGEVVRNGRSGFVVPAKDAQAIADAIMRILGDVGVRTRFALEAKRLGETDYSWAGISRRTANLYESMISASASAGRQTG